MLSVKNLRKVYRSKKAEEVVALNNVTIDFPETGFVFLLGKSGSGKSTLLNAIGGLDKFDGGEIIIKGKSSADFSQADFDSYRNTFIGFIFQEYNILENFSVAKNLALALELQGKKADHEEVMKLLTQVEMQDYAKRKPNELSGGQKQRVAIARALIKNPEIIMADEPTGALDSNTGKQVMDTLKELSKTKLVIVVSHDREFAELYGDRIIELKDGKILHDITKKEIVAQETKSGIKIIDNDIVYIKKGQEVTPNELKAINDIINERLKISDTFISFNKEANEKLKEGAKINDSGNKEKFLKTEKEDIKVKEYNPNSLKLIKSRLKFSDSFKMGASSLKNKVGKLIFTILLSFIAFTLFGVVDAFACWNRADSVYQATRLTEQTTILMTKQNKGDSWSKPGTLFTEYEAIKKKFPDYAMKGVTGKIDLYGSPSLNVEGLSSNSRGNLVYKPQISGYVNFTESDLTKFGFQLIEGDLPQPFVETDSDPNNNYNEAAISKHMFESLKKEYKKEDDPNWNITSQDIFVTVDHGDISNNNIGQRFKIVGVIDDKSDFSEYTELTDEEISKNTLLQQQINSTMFYSSARLFYVSEDIYEKVLELGTTTNNTWFFDESNTDDPWTGYSVYEVSSKQSILDAGSSATIHYYKGGHTNYTINDINLKKGEILVPSYYMSRLGEGDVLNSLVETGLKINIGGNRSSDSIIMSFTVVGFSNIVIASEEDKEILDGLSKGYSMILSQLKQTEADRDFIDFCESFNENNVRFVIQNNATTVVDLLDSIADTMTSILIWVAVGFAVFAAILMMNFISTSINYKKREIGVLRALGARGSDIFGIFFNEATIIAFINFVLASVATIVTCTLINSAMVNELGMSITLLIPSVRQILLILAVSWGSAFLSSLIPTVKISKKRPIDAINNR